MPDDSRPDEPGSSCYNNLHPKIPTASTFPLMTLRCNVATALISCLRSAKFSDDIHKLLHPSAIVVLRQRTALTGCRDRCALFFVLEIAVNLGHTLFSCFVGGDLFFRRK